MPTIVVGYDASPAAHAAVELAIERAGSDGRVIVVHAYHVPPEYLGASYYEEVLNKAVERANAEMDELERDVPALASVEHETEAVEGPAAEVLCRVAHHRGADEIVLGTRGVGRMRGLLGSVAHDVLHMADRPVLVVPERAVRDQLGAGAGSAAV